jgi:hypothetical protein
MNTLYNTAIIETRGVRTIAGGGTNSSTVSGALSSLFVPNNISVASNTITIGTSGVGTLNVSLTSSGTVNVGTGGSGTINVGTNGAGTVNALGIPKFASLTANGTAIGPAITNFGLPTVSLAANAVYELVYDIFYIKTTAGNIIYTLVGTANFITANGSYVQTPIAGLQGSAAAAAITSANSAITGPSITFPNTGTLAIFEHHATISFFIRTGTTATNMYLAVTSSAGTIRPSVNSYYKLTRIS